MNNLIANLYLKELEAEYTATRKCLERIPETLFDYKPHPTSMPLGYLAQLVSEIPLWVSTMAEKSEIDLATFPHPETKTTKALLDHYEENIQGAKKALQNISDDELQQPFSLKANGQVMYTAPKAENIGSTLNHWVHHRGQLTVYMRLNEIAIPSIYGPSADEKVF